MTGDNDRYQQISYNRQVCWWSSRGSVRLVQSDAAKLLYVRVIVTELQRVELVVVQVVVERRQLVKPDAVVTTVRQQVAEVQAASVVSARAEERQLTCRHTHTRRHTEVMLSITV